MTANEKAKAKSDQAVGAAKKTAGEAVGNERLTAEGKAQQMKGDARQAKEKTKDIGKH
ncbi:CsbD family protein [Streptomyces sp. NPDC088785]|uniref:CsbD family protein n=1 Tax=Streptomyces sp. NPDC088785 TaxID=3365897 RepID=UPI003823745F